MNESTGMQELKTEVASLKVTVGKIKEGQIKIAHALLGSFEKDGAGLLEQQRINVKDIIDLKSANSELKSKLDTHAGQITELQTFKSEIKKVVAIIAFAIPLVFEILKGIAEVVWDTTKHHFGF